MTLHKGLGLLVLGVATYALYKTGTLKTVTKTAVNTGAKVSNWTSEKLAQIKESDCFKTKETAETIEAVANAQVAEPAK